MKKLKRGFTLVELLAVIVILGIILVIAGTNVMRIRKNANIEEAKKLEQTLTDLGPNVYSHEYISGVKDYESYCKDNGYTWDNDNCKDSSGNAIINDNQWQDYFYYKYNKDIGVNKDIKHNISVSELKKAGYLKSEEIKVGTIKCEAALQVTKTSGGPVFNGYVCCPGLYKTNESGEPSSCTAQGGVFNLTKK